MRYGDLEGGELFVCNGSLCLMSEYANSDGRLIAYIVGSGECFWGGTASPEVRDEFEVVDVTKWLEAVANCVIDEL